MYNCKQPIYNQMKYLEITPKIVKLKGISLNGFFTLFNKNEFLSCSYTIEVKDSFENSIIVFPEKGMLLKGEEQKIKIKYNSQNTESSMLANSATVIIHFSYKNEFNRQILKKYEMKGWKSIPSKPQTEEIEIVISQDRELIKKYIKQEVAFQNNLQKDNNISAIVPQDKSFIDQSSYYNLGIDSKISQFDLRNRSKNIQNPNLSIVSNRSIHPLQFGESKVQSAQIQPSKIGEEEQNSKLIKSKFIVSPIKNIAMQTVHNQNQILNELSSFHKSVLGDNESEKNLQLIILAVIAAFFVALGNNIGRIFK